MGNQTHCTPLAADTTVVCSKELNWTKLVCVSWYEGADEGIDSVLGLVMNCVPLVCLYSQRGSYNVHMRLRIKGEDLCLPLFGVSEMQFHTFP